MCIVIFDWSFKACVNENSNWVRLLIILKQASCLHQELGIGMDGRRTQVQGLQWKTHDHQGHEDGNVSAGDGAEDPMLREEQEALGRYDWVVLTTEVCRVDQDRIVQSMKAYVAFIIS